MATTRYSKTVIKHVIEDGDDTRVYSIFKLGAEEILTIGLSLSKTLLPALGTGVDYFRNEKNADMYGEMPHTFGAALDHLCSNLVLEDYIVLADKVLGNMLVNSKPIDSWAEHFDEYPQDLLEVLAWGVKENVSPFFLKNSMFQSLMPTLQTMIEKLKNLKDGSNNETTTE